MPRPSAGASVSTSRRRRGPGAANPSGAAGEQLAEPADLDHVQGMATGAEHLEHLVERVHLDHVQEMAIAAGGTEHLVPWIPARRLSSRQAVAY